MRISPIFRVLCLATLFVSCHSVIYEVHPCDDLSAKIVEAIQYSRNNPGSDVRVLLTGGTYRLDEPIVIEGVRGPFTMGVAGRARPLIAGDVDIRGWRPSEKGDGIFEADIDPDLDLGGVISDSNRMDFYACDERQEPARWPNGGEFARAGKCLDSETKNHVNGIFEYCDDRISRWTAEKDPHILGYWCWDWYESYKRISSIDTVARSMTVDPLGDMYGYNDGFRYFGLNLLCELDEEGEYYIDRDLHRIYWMAPEGFFERKHPTTRISLFAADAAISAVGCRKLKIECLEFRGLRGGAISFKDCVGSSIKDCYAHCIGETAVTVSGGESNSIRGCKFHQLGKMGIVACGGNRKTLEPADFVVKKCEFEHFALFRHTYNPAINFGGVGARISKCEFRHSSSSAIITGGNDIIIANCKFSHLVEESDDQGAIESFGNYAYRRCIIRFNEFADICGGTKYGSAAVRFDDMISGNEVYGNVFKRCGSLKFGAVQIHGGRDNRVHHNLFVDCNYSISCSPWTMDVFRENWEKYRSRWDDINLTAEPYVSRYPELLEPVDSLNVNRNFFYDNLSLRSNEEIFRGEHLVKKMNVCIK